MASEVEPGVGQYIKLKITCFEDIERVMKENDITRQYREHLKRINICILMFEELETNRSWRERFEDWDDGERNKIDGEKLIKRLKEFKEEILNGIRIYLRLLAQKEKLKKYFQSIKVINEENFMVEGKLENTSSTEVADNPTPLNRDREVNAKCTVFMGKTAVSVAVGSIILSICSNYCILPELVSGTIIPGALIPGVSTTVFCLAGFGLVSQAIYNLAKSKDEERTSKYQEVQYLQNELNEKLLHKIIGKNASLKGIYEVIDELLHKKEITVQLASFFYSESKAESLEYRTSNEPELTAEMCEKLSRRDAKLATKSYLKRELNCSNEKADEILSEAQSPGE